MTIQQIQDLTSRLSDDQIRESALFFDNANYISIIVLKSSPEGEQASVPPTILADKMARSAAPTSLWDDNTPLPFTPEELTMAKSQLTADLYSDGQLTRTGCIVLSILLVQSKTKDGKYLFRNINDWWSIYPTLVHREDYPREATTFFRSLDSLEIKRFRVSCQQYNFFELDGVYKLPLKEWKVTKYRGKNKGPFLHKWEVAQTFEKIHIAVLKENGHPVSE